MAQGGLGREGEWRERNRDSGHMRKNHCQNIQQTIYKSLHQWAYLPSQILDSNEGLDVLPAASHSHQCPPPVKPTLSFRFRASTSPSLGVILGQHEASPVKVQPRQVAPPRVRKFIPKLLILVKRMKARQLVLKSSSESCIAPASLTRSKTALTTPLSTHVTSPMHQASVRDTFLSSSHSSSSVSFLASLHNNDVCGSCFGMMPRPMGCLSLLTLDEHSSSTDTFVADSPCLVKKTSSNVPLLITENETANIYLDTASDPGKKFVSHAWIPAVLLDSVSADFVH
ncbi:hypothetical protein EV363DRAFT_1302508 [Boletus edulis]|nr:hypothetical protein EV363DRAFT_1302508 [Boletus edulis]